MLSQMNQPYTRVSNDPTMKYSKYTFPTDECISGSAQKAAGLKSFASGIFLLVFQELRTSVPVLQAEPLLKAKSRRVAKQLHMKLKALLTNTTAGAHHIQEIATCSAQLRLGLVMQPVQLEITERKMKGGLLRLANLMHVQQMWRCGTEGHG